MPKNARQTRITRKPHVEAETVGNWRHHHVGRHLGNALRRFDERVLRLVREAGYKEDRLIFHTVIRYLDIKGTRLTELARRANMTKQAMSELVDQVRKFGVVKQQPDPTDRRARLIVFTTAGLKMLEANRRAIRKAESDMQKEIGIRRMALLQKALADYGSPEQSLAVNGKRRTR